MATEYLIVYLLFILIFSLGISFLVFRLKVPSPRAIIAAAIIFIVSPLFLGYFYLIYFNALPEVIVPAVAGWPLNSAAEKLESVGLHAKNAGSIFETNYPEGAVVSQRPEGGRRVKAGRVVNLMLSSGKRKVIAPNLSGRTLQQINEIIASAQLNLGEIKFERNPDLPEGTILAQEPLAGEEIAAGSPLDLLASTTLEGK